MRTFRILFACLLTVSAIAIPLVSPPVASAATYRVTVTKTGSGTVTSYPAGINCGWTCSANFTANSTVTLAATPAAGQTFKGWSGGCTGTANCTLTMNAAKSVTATFAATPKYQLSVTKSGSGSVTSNPAGINCGFDCSENYLSGTSVKLTATPASGQTFLNWTGACTGAITTCTVSMNAAKSVGANFGTTYALTVTKTGNGTITSNPAGINCGTDCTENYAANTSVTLTAAPAAGNTFTGWSGACTGTGPCTVTMNAAKTAAAAFALSSQNYPLTLIAKDGDGGGTVTSSPAGINCGSDCTENYASGTSVTLTAVANEGSVFTGWSGACTGTSTTCTVTMNAAKEVRASFYLLFSLTIVIEGNGTVTTSPAGIDCGSDCTEKFRSGSYITLYAAPGEGTYFGGWGSLVCYNPTETSCTFGINRDTTVIARFTESPKLEVIVSRLDFSGGTVTSEPAGINCLTDCTEAFPAGTRVTLTATPAAGSYFSHWISEGTCADAFALTCTVTMDKSRKITAEFRDLKALTIEKTGAGTGAVTSDPAGIDCGSDCTGEFRDDGWGESWIALTATPAPGSIFVGWSGWDYWSGEYCADNTPTCSVTMAAGRTDRTITAEFAPEPETR